MLQPVYISGMGIISSIGSDTEEVLNSIRSNIHGISKISILQSAHNGILLAGEIKATNSELAQRLSIEDASAVSRTALLGMIAARETVAKAKLDLTDGMKTGLISSTTVGGIDKSEEFYQSFLGDQSSGKLRHVIGHDCGDSTEKIANDLGIHHFVSTISTACSSSANAIMSGARLISNGILDRAILGGSDALTRYTVNGFNALKILDSEHCKPFDSRRNGLNLGEGAAYILLESEASLKARGAEPIGQLTGYGNANDAFHQTASSPDGKGAYSAMSLAMKNSGLQTSDIDYVNVHGTATIVNDQSEGTALKKLFDSQVPDFSSTKSFTGHTLAAAGSIEAVISLLAINNRFLPPNLNFEQQIPELGISPITQLKETTQLKHILSNSLGFGGNCSSLVLSKV